MPVSRPVTEKQWICCDCLRLVLSLTDTRFVSKKEEEEKGRMRWRRIRRKRKTKVRRRKREEDDLIQS